MKLAMRIRVARQHAKLSQAELATVLGVTRGAVANWESTEDAHPIASRLIEMAVLTKVSIEWLVAGRGPMTFNSKAEEIPAVDGEFVYDATERRLLAAYRNASAHEKSLILKMVEPQAVPSRKVFRKLEIGR